MLNIIGLQFKIAASKSLLQISGVRRKAYRLFWGKWQKIAEMQGFRGEWEGPKRVFIQTTRC
jgi:hypothetical protein